MMKSWATTAACALLTITAFLSISVLLSTPAQAEQGLEYKVKAAFLYNFIKFIDWPTDRLGADDKSINVCLLGKDPFGPHLEPIQNRTAKGHAIRIVRLKDPTADLSTCRMLFTTTHNMRDVKSIADKIKGQAILTVGEADGFASNGGMIGFVIRDGRIQLEINLERIKRENISVSAKLLEIGVIVSDNAVEPAP